MDSDDEHKVVGLVDQECDQALVVPADTAACGTAPGRAVRRLSMSLVFPAQLQPVVWGITMSMTAEATPIAR